jgi:hypothetical protein
MSNGRFFYNVILVALLVILSYMIKQQEANASSRYKISHECIDGYVFVIVLHASTHRFTTTQILERGMMNQHPPQPVRCDEHRFPVKAGVQCSSVVNYNKNQCK